VEGGHPDPAKDYAEEDQGVARGYTDERHPYPREQHAERHEGRDRTDIRKDSKERLHHRGADGRRQYQRSGRGQGEAALRN
jgi:hypothetical protein